MWQAASDADRGPVVNAGGTTKEKAMNLHAHPYIVAAELAWKQESLAHANLTDDVAAARRAGRAGGGRPALRWLRRRAARPAATATRIRPA
jgi:hypothetical protein